MDALRSPILALAKQRLDWTGHRQTVLAQTIANADTPGARAFDLEAFRGIERERPGARFPGLVRTNAQHLPGPPPRREAAGDSEAQRRTYEVAPAGNAVVLEEQLAKVAETATQHQIATLLYQKNLGFLRLALGAPGG